MFTEGLWWFYWFYLLAPWSACGLVRWRKSKLMDKKFKLEIVILVQFLSYFRPFRGFLIFFCVDLQNFIKIKTFWRQKFFLWPCKLIQNFWTQLVQQFNTDRNYCEDCGGSIGNLECNWSIYQMWNNLEHFRTMLELLNFVIPTGYLQFQNFLKELN